MEESPADDVVIQSLLPSLGVTWSRAEQERRLFALCVHVQATLAARYGAAYRTTDISRVPAAYVAEVKEILGAEFLTCGQRD